MVENKETVSFKVCMIGESGVGKTCVAQRYVNDKFSTNFQATTGGNLLSKTETVQLPGDTAPTKVRLQIWDTAGQDAYRSITSTYYKGAQAVVMIYDSTSNESFE